MQPSMIHQSTSRNDNRLLGTSKQWLPLLKIMLFTEVKAPSDKWIYFVGKSCYLTGPNSIVVVIIVCYNISCDFFPLRFQVASFSFMCIFSLLISISSKIYFVVVVYFFAQLHISCLQGIEGIY